MELALASLHSRHFSGGVATHATHQLAPVDARTSMITFPPVCSEGPLFDVELAVVWRGLQVDQVGVGVGLETLEFGHQHPPTPLLFLMNLMSAVELVLQNLPDHSEGSDRPPAGF